MTWLRTMPAGKWPAAWRSIAASAMVAGALTLGAAPAAAGDVDLSFSTPTNENEEKVTVRIGGTSIEVFIPAGKTAKEKRDLIFDKIAANKVPKFTLAKKGDTGLTIKNLAKNTKVTFFPGRTGEPKDEKIAFIPQSGGFGFDSSVFASTDPTGTPSTFTAGFITDVGEFSVTLSALDLPDLSGETIIDELLEQLLPVASSFGVQLLNLGREVEVVFDPLATDEVGGGVIFGTTSPTEGAFGYIVVGIPEPGTVALTSLGLVAAGGMAQRRRRQGASQAAA